jgi:hypothetical protein
MKIGAWTDFAIRELGDKAGAAAPIREVTVVAYDGAGYATALCCGKVVEIDINFLYARPQSEAEPERKALVVAVPPSFDGSAKFITDSAYIRIKKARAGTIHDRIRNF